MLKKTSCIFFLVRGLCVAAAIYISVVSLGTVHLYVVYRLELGCFDVIWAADKQHWQNVKKFNANAKQCKRKIMNNSGNWQMRVERGEGWKIEFFVFL